MSRITISLPEELAVLLERESERRATSISEVVRRALATHFGTKKRSKDRLPFAGLGRSGHRHTARDAEKILAKDWTLSVRRR